MKNNVVIIALLLLLSSAVFAQSRKPALSPEEKLNATYCSGLFSTADGVYFDLEKDANFFSSAGYINILDWLQGRVAGLQVYSYRNTRIPVIRNYPAAVFVDEMRIDAGFLNLLPVSDIAMIKIIKSPFLGSWGTAGGAIAIYTKGGEESDEETNQ